ncbi:hypothetical protein L6452_25790 [Arctium lappa]|uniref:Uncharacterized protein n=1 Tax=Arctium lappa TaxID=4217 RepID=A0ACB9ACC1_ARCLA|nr:hypothetical protein L6452_25790 [Arctium lappa]
MFLFLAFFTLLIYQQFINGCCFPVSWNYLRNNHHQHSKTFSTRSCSTSSKYPHTKNPLNTSLKSITNTQISAPITVHGSPSKFWQPGTRTTRSNRMVSLRSTGSDSSIASNILPTALGGIVHLVVSLGIILATDNYLKEAFVAVASKFPSALFGIPGRLVHVHHRSFLRLRLNLKNQNLKIDCRLRNCCCDCRFAAFLRRHSSAPVLLLLSLGSIRYSRNQIGAKSSQSK